MQAFAGRTTLVTGGARGIGYACARHLAERGSNLVLLDLDGAQLERAKADLAKAAPGVNVICQQADVTDTERLEAVATELEARKVLVDHLITAAGIMQPIKDIEVFEKDYHDRLWAINYHGTYQSCRLWAAPMRQRRFGSVVLVSSVTSMRATPLLAYGPAKAALTALTASLAVTHAPYGVRINAVAPGFTLTEGFDEKLKSGQREASSILSRVPMARFVSPEEVAKSTTFLLSPEASAVTGITLPVDCGWLAGSHWATFQPLPREQH